MELMEVEFCQKFREILNSVDTFNIEIPFNQELAIDLSRRTSYWVYDSEKDQFCPSKFVAFKGMDFKIYDKARYTPKRTRGVFNGKRTRTEISKIIEKQYHSNDDLSLKLMDWAIQRFSRDIFKGISKEKWKFIVI